MSEGLGLKIWIDEKKNIVVVEFETKVESFAMTPLEAERLSTMLSSAAERLIRKDTKQEELPV
ncbi:MAG: hypothetical protein EBZ49_00295 [Proteobacteria bacterium]|nr:hypothetical protein [Pseudomonadota bacterium]